MTDVTFTLKNTQDLVTIGADKYNVHAVLARMQILFFSPVTNSCHHYQLHYCFVCINSVYMNKLLNAAAILVAKIAEAVNKLQAVKFSSGNFIVFMIIIKKIGKEINTVLCTELAEQHTISLGEKHITYYCVVWSSHLHCTVHLLTTSKMVARC